MDFIAVVIVLTLLALAALGGWVLFCIRVSGLVSYMARQSDREAQFLASEMDASYDAAKHVRGEE
ncbi:hypothetical protein [Stenotrophomonas sp. BIGb0135]|uniref:hypothetical protein n=1 Tax=Stenotrophomonas sp. BIGb0135 TaxID=2940620 RepID=UPI0021690AB8|nr:hypothetical protein [Stenotrophomonas sp. BIGb0135]MCS4234449.1 hypothetical protein [Stenotrophomonas sp. BIGb0135]